MAVTAPDAFEQPARRLSDKIEQAFDQACRQGQLEVAACMLKGLDLVLLGKPESWDRRQASLTVMRSMYARLAQLREAEASMAKTGGSGTGTAEAEPASA